MQYKDLEKRVINWAELKGILKHANPINQLEKTEEEVQELRDAIFAQHNNLEFFRDSKGRLKNTSDEIKDALGDVLVTIIIGAEMNNLCLLDCLESALNIIEKRKGKMQNGKFVKDED